MGQKPCRPTVSASDQSPNWVSPEAPAEAWARVLVEVWAQESVEVLARVLAEESDQASAEAWVRVLVEVWAQEPGRV